MSSNGVVGAVVRPIGILIMEDNAGHDEKIPAVPSHKLAGQVGQDRRLARRGHGPQLIVEGIDRAAA